MNDADRRRRLRLAQRAVDDAIGLLRNASDSLKTASDYLTVARSEDRPGEHQGGP